MTPTNAELIPTLENVRALLKRDGRHAFLLPILARDKAPKFKGWSKLTYAETQSGEYQQRLRSSPNTGVLLGGPSDDLCAIDIDSEEACAAFLEANPRFAQTLRTRGSRGAQFWAYITGERPHQIHPLKVKATSPLAVGVNTSPDDAGLVTIGELRAEGGQSVIRGIHPEGKHYRWLCGQPPITIDFGDIFWPTDIALPWLPAPVTGARDATPPVGSKAQEQQDDTLLARAVAKLDINFLWSHFGYPDRQGRNPVASPFRTDNTKGHPAFSVFDQGRAFKDHNASYPLHRGNSFAFYQLATGQDPKTAFVPFVTLAGLRDELYVTRKAAVVDKLISLGFTEAVAKRVWHSIDHSGSIPELLERACSQTKTIQSQPATPPSDPPGNDDFGRNPSFRQQLVRDYGNNVEVQKLPPFKPWDECLRALSDQYLTRYGSTQGLSWDYCTGVLRDLGWLGIYEEHFALPIHGPGGVVIAEQVLTPEQEPKFFITAGAGDTLSPFILGNLPLATRILIFCSGRELNAFADRSELYRDPTTCLIATRGHQTAKLLANLPWPVALQSGPTVFLLTKNDSRSGLDGLTNSGRWSAAARAFIPFGTFLVPPPAPHHDFLDATRAGTSKNDLIALLDSYEHGQSDPLPPAAQLTSQEQEDRDEPDWEKHVQEISIDQLLAFDRSNDPDSLIGNRWLCRGDTAVIQGETGVGKSTLVMQAIICWALDQPLFGIKGRGVLKSLLIESENNKGDLAEVFQDVTKALTLSAAEIAYLKTKIVIVRESAKTGPDFLKLARRLIRKHQPDLVFADPLLSYLGDNVSDQKAMSAFLRNGLQPIVNLTKVIWFWVHHFGKPPRSGPPATRRSVYSGLGSVEIPGWARETITVNAINEQERLCEIQFGKRARRVGLADKDANPIDKIYIQQSKNAVLWELADPEQVKNTTGAAAHYGRTAREVRAFIEKKVNVTHPQLEAFAKQIQVGEKKVISIARALVDDAQEPRIYEYRLRGRTKGNLAFSTVTQDLNPIAFIPARKKRKKAVN